MKNTDNTQTKHNPEKSNNANHRKTKLAWLSRLKRQSATKRGGLILQRGSGMLEQSRRDWYCATWV